MTPRLSHAIREARRIRKNLVRLRGNRALDGDCGLASCLLADTLGSARSLRYADMPHLSHVWNVVDGVIIDITATQFNENGAAQYEPRVTGVLITTTPRIYHTPIAWRGCGAVRQLRDQDWYVEDEDRTYARLPAVFRRLLQARPAGKV